MKYAEIMLERMRQMGINKKQLADMSGLPYMTVSNILSRGAEKAGLQNVFAICRVLGIDTNVFSQTDTCGVHDYHWGAPILDAYTKACEATQKNVCKLLDCPHVAPSNVVAFKPKHSRTIKMPVASDSAAAGIPIYAESDFEFIDFAEEDVPTGADFGVRISGDSMEPTISDEDIVWVRKQPAVANGDVGVFMLGDSAVCKRAKLDAAGRLKSLESDNSAYAPITGYDLADVRCVGKVLFK